MGWGRSEQGRQEERQWTESQGGVCRRGGERMRKVRDQVQGQGYQLHKGGRAKIDNRPEKRGL